MTIDLSTITPTHRVALVKIGQGFGSSATLAQANKTLAAIALHGAKLGAFGFTQADVTRLGEARDALIAKGTGRETRRTGKKVAQSTHATAIRQGQAARFQALSVLRATEQWIAQGGVASESTANTITAALVQHAATPKDALALARQLGALHDVLSDPEVAAAAMARGGPKAKADLKTTASALQAAVAAKAGPRGTPLESEEIDLLDGIVVGLVRSAAAAAKAAAKALGEPSLALAFSLDALYRKGRKKQSAAEEMAKVA